MHKKAARTFDFITLAGSPRRGLRTTSINDVDEAEVTSSSIQICSLTITKGEPALRITYTKRRYRLAHLSIINAEVDSCRWRIFGAIPVLPRDLCLIAIAEVMVHATRRRANPLLDGSPMHQSSPYAAEHYQFAIRASQCCCRQEASCHSSKTGRSSPKPYANLVSPKSRRGMLCRRLGIRHLRQREGRPEGCASSVSSLTNAPRRAARSSATTVADEAHANNGQPGNWMIPVADPESESEPRTCISNTKFQVVSLLSLSNLIRGTAIRANRSDARRQLRSMAQGIILRSAQTGLKITTGTMMSPTIY